MPAVVLRRVLAAALVSLVLASPSSAGGDGPRPAERRLRALVNEVRVEAEADRLTVRRALTRIARKHSRRMADEDRIFHNDDLEEDVGEGWTILAENVGYASDAESMFEWFMDSPPHRRNILEEDVERIGVGVAHDEDGVLWVTIVFVG